jgi:hypothetical protein
MQWFCLSLHRLLPELNETLKEHNGFMVAYADDLFLAGPQDIVTELFNSIKMDCHYVGLEVREDKCKLLTFNSHQLHPLKPKPCIEILGTPVGKPDAEIAMLEKILSESNIYERLEWTQELQCRLLLLRQTIATKFQHWSRTMSPHCVQAALKHLDRCNLTAFSHIIGVESFDPLKAHEINLPRSMGGLGIKPLARQCGLDYYTSLSTAIIFWRNKTSAKLPLLQALKFDNPVSRALKESLEYCHNVHRLFRDPKAKIVPSSITDANPEKFLTMPATLKLPATIDLLMANPSPNPTKLQATLCLQDSINQFRILWRSRDADDNHRIQVLASTTKTPSIFLQTLPTEPALYLANKELRLSLCEYFGLSPNEELGISEKIKCCCSKSQPGKTKYLTSTHLNNCRHNMSFTNRHEKLADVICEAAKSVNIQSQREAAVSRPPEVGVNDQDLPMKRFDILLPPLNGYGNKQICIDVTGASHTRVSHLSKARKTALHNINRAIAKKKAKYAEFVDNDTQIFVVLACESTGAIGANFAKILGALGSRANHLPPPQASSSVRTFEMYWMQRVSIALWSQTAQAKMRIANESLKKSGHNAFVPAELIDGEDDMITPIAHVNTSTDQLAIAAANPPTDISTDQLPEELDDQQDDHSTNQLDEQLTDYSSDSSDNSDYQQEDLSAGMDQDSRATPTQPDEE